MSLFVSSHYKNSPNDLQLMSDAPAHRLFVLLGPQVETASGDSSATALPDVLAVIQVCLEGRISRDSMRAALARGGRASGDLIPWTLSQQFQDDGFAGLSGARIVRIATHPDATRLGYGTRALALLTAFYEGKLVTYVDGEDDGAVTGVEAGISRDYPGDADASLGTERVRPRKELPPLLVPVSDIRRPDALHWLGTSYGLTTQLFNFWRRGGFAPVYLRQTANDLTAEHTTIMIRPLDNSAAAAAPQTGWCDAFVADFARRYMQLLSFEFRSFDPTLALSVMDAATTSSPAAGGGAEAPLSTAELGVLYTPHDLKRLESYARNLVDYHMILDLLPDAARLYFTGRLLARGALPRLQAAILLSLGLQRLPVEAIADHFAIPVNTALALFNKAVRKLAAGLRAVVEHAAEAEVDADRRPASGIDARSAKKTTGSSAAKTSPTVEEDDDVYGTVEDPVLPAAASAALLTDPELRQYAVPTDTDAWAEALAGPIGAGIKAAARKKRDGAAPTVDDDENVVARTLSVRKTPVDDGGSGGAAKSAAASASGDDRKKRGRDSHGGKHKGADERFAAGEVYDPRGRLEAKHAASGGASGKKKRPHG